MKDTSSYQPGKYASVLYFVGSAIMIIAMLFQIFHFTGFWEGNWGLVAVVAFVLTHTLFPFLYRLEQRWAQRIRNNAAKRLFESVQNGDVIRYCLYLRPFFTSANVNVKNSDRTHWLWWPRISNMFKKKIDIETLFTKALEEDCPVIAIGDLHFIFGAGKITTTDKTWKETFIALAENASLIVVVPFNRPGIRWEVIWLINHKNLLTKTVFFMPPKVFSIRIASTEKLWNEIQKAMEHEGIIFPAFQPEGAFFMIQPDNLRYYKLVSSKNFTTEDIRSLLRNFV